MNLSEPFIKRPVMTSLLVFALIFLGVTSYRELPVSNMPSVSYPTLVVNAGMPGSSPETMANSVTTPLERAFMSIQGVQIITSTSKQSSSEIILQFTLDTNIDVAAENVSAAISSTQPLLPPNMPTNPSYQKLDPSQTPTLYIVLSSPVMRLSDLYDYANTYVGERISILPGVGQIQTYGSPYAARLQMDPELLAARKVDFATISSTVQQDNANLPTGDIDGSTRYFLMDADGQLNDAKAYNSMIISFQNNAPLTLKAVGRAVDGLQNPHYYSTFITKDRNEAAVALGVFKQPSANAVKISESVKKILPELENSLPASIKLTVTLDYADFITQSVDDVKTSLLIAFFLVVMVIFIYLGKITDTMIPLLVLPMSIVGTFFVMKLLNYSLDNLSLLALTLSIGFIVDDAIVVLENIVRHAELGERPYEAAMKGSSQISVTVFTMTVCLSSIFIPMLFMEGILGRIFHEFAVTIVITILFSGIISLTLTPMLCSRFIPAREKKDPADKKHTFSEKLNMFLITKYGFLLAKVLKHPRITLGVGILCLICTVLIFRSLPSSLNNDQDIGFIDGYIKTAQGSSSASTNAKQLQVNEVLRQDKNIESFESSSGEFNDNGSLYIKLKPLAERSSVKEVMKELDRKLREVPGINVFLKSKPLIDLSTGTGSNSSYQYVVCSFDLQDLYTYSTIMTEKIKELSGFENVNNNLTVSTPRLSIMLNRENLIMYGLNASSVENLLGLAYGGGKVSTILTAANEYYVVVEVDPAYQQKPENLKSLWLKSPTTGNMVPLEDLISWKETLGASSINHYNQFPSVTISFDLARDLPLSEASLMLENLAANTLPAGVTGQVVGAALAFEATMNSIVFLLVVAVIFIYAILGILYESIILPITVLSALPIAVLGALITLLIFGEILSLYAMVGLMLLIGIVQKNGIMMIDYAHVILKEPGKTAHEAIYQACLIRFRPIIMTTIAAIMGSLPVALGLGEEGSVRQPLGLVIVGGLIFSQLITLFLTPVVFLYFESLQEFLIKKFKIRTQLEVT
ncbi:MAG: efflux RND transporter permease subunit [Chlamydiales bacterium]|nr:efflux RND transporter permease subunit [Chlamydiales bacterium]